jgi:hypothetical protein
MLDHDRSGQLRRVDVLCQSRQRGGYLSVPAVNRVQVTIRATLSLLYADGECR